MTMARVGAPSTPSAAKAKAGAVPPAARLNEDRWALVATSVRAHRGHERPAHHMKAGRGVPQGGTAACHRADHPRKRRATPWGTPRLETTPAARRDPCSERAAISTGRDARPSCLNHRLAGDETVTATVDAAGVATALHATKGEATHGRRRAGICLIIPRPAISSL
jgi:hypothetical protein